MISGLELKCTIGSVKNTNQIKKIYKRTSTMSL